MKKGMEHQFQETYAIIKYILDKLYTETSNDFTKIFESFKVAKEPNTDGKLCTILSMYLNLLEYYLHDIFNISQNIKLDFINTIFKSRIVSITISESSTAEQACLQLIIEFKHAINYAFDLVYFIYLFHVDKSILYTLKEYTYNTIQLFLHTKHFLKLGGGNNTRSSRTSQPQLNAYNIQGNWLKNILEMHYAVNSKNDGLLLLLQIKIEALLSDSHKLLMNTQDTVARLCQDVIGKIKSNGAYKIDDKAKTFVLNHIIKAVIDSLKIDLNKDASLLKLTDEEKNRVKQNYSKY
jgi:hypothetical protein